MNPRRLLKLFLVILSVSVLLGYMIPQHFIMPVAGAGKNSYNKSSFWFYPWGKSITHKGVDIFAPEGTGVISSTGGIVLFSGVLERAGNAVLVLGPKWRLHYYAHLKEIKISAGRVVYTENCLVRLEPQVMQKENQLIYIIPFPPCCQYPGGPMIQNKGGRKYFTWTLPNTWNKLMNDSAQNNPLPVF